MNYFVVIFSIFKKRITKILLILIVLLVIPLTVFISQKQQEIKQRAAGNEAPTSSICQVPKLPLEMPVLALEYFPPDPTNSTLLDGNETGWGSDATINGRTISFWEQKTDEMIDLNLKTVSESTKFHGYKDPTAQQFLDYSVIERKKFYQPILKGFSLGVNDNKIENFRPNYSQILKNINVCDYVDNKGVKEIWMYGYHNGKGGIVPDESRMSSKYGDISNSIPKENQIPEEFRMPICNKSYTLYNFTYQPGGKDAAGNNIHNRLHQFENIIPFTENKWPPIREDQPGSNIKSSIFWGDFSEYTQDYTKRDNYISSCGNSHNPPNWANLEQSYFYSDIAKRQFDCEDWNPDPSKTKYITAGCERWSCTDIGFHKWWMQNLPGYSNGIVYNGQPMRNWWEAMYDFNAFIDRGKSLFGDSIFCSVQPTPTSTPTFVPPTITITPTITLTPTPILVPTLILSPTPVPGDNLVIFNQVNFGGILDSNTATHTDKNIFVYLYGQNQDPSQDIEGKTVLPIKFSKALKYNPSTKSYQSGPLDIGNIPDGTKILIKIDKYLRKLVSVNQVPSQTGGTFEISISSNTNFVPGDVNGDNIINIVDYAMIVDCFGDKQCDNKEASDLNEDGKIDGIDYNVFLKSLSLTARNGD